MNDFSTQPLAVTARAAARSGRRRAGPARALRWVLGALLALLLLNLALMLYWGRQPPVFDVVERAQAEVAAAGGSETPAGVATTAAIIGIGDTLLNKPGGFLHNDRLPPGAIMDNCPSWECGVVMALRDAVQALRDDFTRAQTQSVENLDVKRADMKLAMDPKAWVLPAAEDAYAEGIAALRAYLGDLAKGQARFYPRADNLADYLGLVEKRLGNFGVRLGAAAGATLDLDPIAGHIADDALPASGMPLDPAGSAVYDPARVDDVFFCARGYSWAFLHVLRGIERDFAHVLADKNADMQIRRIVHDLEGAIKPMRSPVVLNGGGFGLLANHSMVAASYVARVNAAVIDLGLLLEQG
ncbi:hypothetical protein CKO31_01455 [Thiohalocapsa halophila]|uniref:DUF2333 family protein n=1 Tax=Thiohalocapsa halophila TaxID=69359 RepID=A0ABS1CBX4_9GAMM|nr:DUF2333 family protein [Thiohalocapsa halophila]MBK1629422.1 hypothetical protein [Thiohalocapsa halophila]